MERAMQLFLVRHAHALAMDDDAARPLSDEGRVATARLGAFLRGTGVFRPAQLGIVRWCGRGRRRMA